MLCDMLSMSLSLIAICENLAKTASGSIAQPNYFTPHKPVQCPIKVALTFLACQFIPRLGWHATVHGR